MAWSDHPRSRRDFQIAIICALQAEHNAVEGVLDDLYESDGSSYGKALGDPNSYTLGRIGNHHVALTYMPGIGKANAASVAQGIRSSFKNVKPALVVGVCGGVPETTDGTKIFLGDVIISTRVLQYDFGRLYSDGAVMKDTVEGNLGPPNNEIQSFLKKEAGLSARQELTDKTFRCSEELCQQPAFQTSVYPGVETDHLYSTDYRHKHQTPGVCSMCDACLTEEDEVCEFAQGASCLDLGCHKSRLISRDRLQSRSSIHFGLVASGDMVLKSAKHRDQMAQRHGVVGFEMEGAGVWNNLPTIVVTTVSDYADSHKHEKWQGYAAVVSASCAKALIEGWRPVDITLEKHASSLESRNRKELVDCLQSLSFGTIDARLHTIQRAHQNTCNWLFDSTEFQQWKSREYVESYQGVLWMKGKPGTGKSTLMKHALLHCQTECPDWSTVAYFFNARGKDALEKSPLGMLRSLIYQLVEQNLVIRKHFLPHFRDKCKKHKRDWEWYLGELRDFLLAMATKGKIQSTFIFVDALDECNEAEIRSVVSILEDLSIAATGSKSLLNICLSSRHYPTINMQKKCELIVEAQLEHNRDIVIYVKDKLKVSDAMIEKELLSKAQSIFLWVVLVVEILNQAFDEGNIGAMRAKLREIPPDLEEVFKKLLLANNRYLAETVLVLQWVLFTFEQLSPEDLYLAVKSGANPAEVKLWDRGKLPNKVIERYIITISKGLIECPKRSNGLRYRRTQFIHQSVNDFLLRNQRLQLLDPTLVPNVNGLSHDCLAKCCVSYLGANSGETSDHELPFKWYAAKYVLQHVEQADLEVEKAQVRLKQLEEHSEVLVRWTQFDWKLFNSWDAYSGIGASKMIHVLTLHGNPSLLKAYLRMPEVNVNDVGGKQRIRKGGSFTALTLAVLSKNEELLQVLISMGADINAFAGYDGNALIVALEVGRKESMEILLKAGANVNAPKGAMITPLQAAIFYGCRKDVQQSSRKPLSKMGALENTHLLLRAGADVNSVGKRHGTALQAACGGGSLEIVQALLDVGADVNIISGRYGTALQVACWKGSLEIVQALLDAGADANLLGGMHRRGLMAALQMEELVDTQACYDMATMLLKKGVNVNACDWEFGSPLCTAIAMRHLEFVPLLLKAGADVNARDRHFRSPLIAALEISDNEVIDLLLKAGAEVDIEDGEYGRRLRRAIETSAQSVIEILNGSIRISRLNLGTTSSMPQKRRRIGEGE